MPDAALSLTELEVWSESFSQKLAIRPASQHKQCGVCVRHKAILKGLAGDRLGRQAQMHEYCNHLQRQYRDRCVYWSLRSQSRLLNPAPSGERVVSLILDGLDHSKMRFPRASCLVSKELGGFNRPNCDLTACIAHGYGVYLIMSVPFLPKDSNLSADVIMHVLHRIASDEAAKGSDFDLRSAHICIQSDNTSRECKNNTSIRLFAAAVGSHLVKKITYQCLVTGHSHEDVDQAFSTISGWIGQHAELHTVEDFRQCLADLLATSTFRPHDPMRYAEVVSSIRDWHLA